MPIKVWSDSEGDLASQIWSNWDHVVTVEEHRTAAEELDHEFDLLLDTAAENLQRDLGLFQERPSPFVQAHSVGSSLAEEDVLNHPSLLAEPEQFRWAALAIKCRLGARSNGTRTGQWSHLRPPNEAIPRREGGRDRSGKGDYFQMCIWLAEQTLVEAADTFGGSIRNVWQMFDRPTLHPVDVRRGLLSWLERQSPTSKEQLTTTTSFPELMKVLVKRWPAKGPGSAWKPIHMSQGEIELQMNTLLDKSKNRILRQAP